MEYFRARLTEYGSGGTPIRWRFVPYDQLAMLGTEASSGPDTDTGLLFIETTWKPAQRPYHKQKLALILANQRQFALEQARRGVSIRYLTSSSSYAAVLEREAHTLGPIQVLEPAERELRAQLEPLVNAGLVVPLPNPFWLTTREDFLKSQSGRADFRMDRFYRFVRKKYEILIDDQGKALGGKWSLDAQNRQPWRGSPAAPSRPEFEHDLVDEEVFELVRTRFADHPGELRPDALPTTQEHADALWQFALESCMELFGPYEDAMSRDAQYLFHTNVSQVLNLNRLSPHQLIRDAVATDARLNSVEGFVRQVLGWREFVRHVHRETDGFRTPYPGGQADGQMDTYPPSHLDSHVPLPAVFWGQPSGLGCLDHVIEEVWDTGYTHHINRLMILANWATLLDIEPKAISDWFWVGFIDAYDWVVEPNVMGMGTYGIGPLMTTKPYVSGAAYVNKMSDYCQTCDFDPRKSCPMTSLYWAFLNRHRSQLTGNQRLALPLASAAKRSPDKQRFDQHVFEHVSSALSEGRLVTITEPGGAVAHG